MDDLYTRIEDLCRQRNESITEMCRKAGVPRSALSDYKHGRIKSIGVDKLRKMAEHFGVAVDYILGDNGAKKASDESEACPDLENEYVAYASEIPLLPEQQREIVIAILEASKKSRELAKDLPPRNKQ